MVRACGSIGYLVMALGVLGVLLAFAAAIARVATTNRTVILAASGASLAVGVLIAGLASLGTTRGRNATDRAVSSGAIAPADAERLRATGYAEASQCLPVGMLSGALPIFAGAVVLVITLLRKDGFAADKDPPAR